ncbi:MAG TPA: LLM class flavin-dependent oxidoreductase [Polyangiaceae bacterium]|nr:LLM class flavin-dependent oxidoreductase [Polyangiaceae bacterium]
MSIPLSVLDLFPVSSSTTPSAVIRQAGSFARAVEALGYARYWVAEHHNMPSIATSAPEVLIAHVAAVTQRIQVGAGGIMLPNHTPLRVIEIFRTLEALHPGRIDLGVGRAPGTDPVTSRALRRDASENVNEQLAQLLAFERGTFPPGHPFHSIKPMPSDVRLPAMWMLGSTLAGATLAASLGLRYAFAGHFAMTHARAALRHYKRHFQPSAELSRPRCILAVNVVCGEDVEHAHRLAAPLRLAVVRLATGQQQPIASVEEALAHELTPQETAIANAFMEGAVIGGPREVRAALLQLASETEVDELMLATLLPGSERLLSFERVAQVLQLSG